MPFLHSLYYTANERKCQGSFPFPLAIEKIFHFFIKKRKSPLDKREKCAILYAQRTENGVPSPFSSQMDAGFFRRNRLCWLCTAQTKNKTLGLKRKPKKEFVL